MKLLNRKWNYREIIPLSIVAIVLIFTVIAIVQEIEMPYDRWFAENVPPWLSIIFCVLLGISIVITAIPQRSFLVNTIALIMLLLSITVLKQTYSKAGDINTAIFVISCIFYLIIKLYFRK